MLGMFGKVPLVTKIAVFAGLTIAALVMLYPFIYMASTSLKANGEIFGNLGLLPYAPVTITVNGEEQPLYEVASNGTTQRMIRVGTGQSLGIFVDPAAPDKEISVAMGKADLNNDKPPFVLKGAEYPIYTVQLDENTTRALALLRKDKVGKYTLPADIDNPDKVVALPDSQVTRVLKIQPQWENYSQVLTLQNMGRALLNTTLVTILVTVGQLFTSAVGGYAFARLSFPGRDGLFLIYLGTIMVPFVVIIIPLYQLMNSLGWINKLVSLIIPWFFTAYGTFFMRQFFQGIPKDLEEAALMDGASRVGVLWRIFIPLSLAPLGTLATFTFLYAWNSFLWPLISINGGNMDDQVISLALNVIRGSVSQGPAIVMAAATLSVLPAVVVFVLAQRYFVEGISTTGLAGR